MDLPTPALKPKIKHKSFNYRTRMKWVGGRAGTLSAKDKTSFRVASPPEFRGESGVWTPEDLFVAATEACIMSTFLAFADRQNLRVISYNSSADGSLTFEGKGYQFTRITVCPEISVADAGSIELAHQLMQRAHENCLISNSIKSSLVLTPVIKVVSE